MYQPNYVSLWLGKAKSVTHLENYVQHCSHSGQEYLPSEFANHYTISHFCQDLIEFDFFPGTTNDLSGLLSGFTEDEFIISQLKELFPHDFKKEYNCAILVYDYYYQGKKQSSIFCHDHYDFIGAVKYREISH